MLSKSLGTSLGGQLFITLLELEHSEGPPTSTLIPSLTSMIVAVEPESSYRDFFRGRGKKVHIGWKLKQNKHEKDGCKG